MLSRRNIVFLLLLLLMGVRFFAGQRPGGIPDDLHHNTSTATEAFQNHLSNIQVEGNGTVIKTLPDDLKGSRHQRILLEVAPGHTVLIAHNIDLAPRIPDLHEGDILGFCGEYEWNDKGGVIHWTHHDSQGKHPPGWLHYKNKTYQ